MERMDGIKDSGDKRLGTRRRIGIGERLVKITNIIIRASIFLESMCSAIHS